MSNDPSWNDIFGSQPGAAPQSNPAPQSAAPQRSRREAREAEARSSGRGGKPPTKRSMYDSGGAGTPPKKKRRLGGLWALISVLVVGAIGAGAVWVLYEDKVREVLGWQLPTDYEGTGNGTAVDVVIKSGDIGEDIARTLAAAGVTMTFDAFYDLLLSQDPAPAFNRARTHCKSK